MTSPSGEPLNGVDVERVTAWIDEHIADAVGPYDFTLIAGGHSNLTFKFTDDGEPGKKVDLAEFTIVDGVSPPVVVSGVLKKGNHQAHPK